MSFPSKTPKAGKRIIGSKLVNPIGNASVTHHNAINTAIAAVIVISGLPGAKSKNEIIPANSSTPKMMTLYFIPLFDPSSFILVEHHSMMQRLKYLFPKR